MMQHTVAWYCLKIYSFPLSIHQCSSECSNGCSGPLESQCKTCRNYRIYVEGKPGMNNTKFNCTATCPNDLPYKIFPEDASDPYCGKDPFPLSL